jgi:hypothetical protein
MTKGKGGVDADSLLPTSTGIKVCGMQRQLVVLILLLAIGLQGSVAAFAMTSPVMSPDCQTSAISHSGMSQDSCCPRGQHAMSCCLELCLSNVAANLSPTAFNWYSRAAPALSALASNFSSRGDSPQIRPPIL